MADEHTHPLFPHEPGDEKAEERRYDFINVRRRLPGQANYVFASRTFRGDELTDESQIDELYGGGDYEIIARDKSVNGKPQYIRDRRYFTRPGPPKPITETEDVSAYAPKVPGAMTPPPMHHHGGGGDGIAAIVPLLMQSQQMMMQFMMSQSLETTKLFTTLLSSKGTEAQTAAQTANENARAQVDLMSRFFTAMNEAKASAQAGAFDLKRITETIDIVDKLRGKASGAEADDLGAVGKTLEVVMQTVGAFALAKQAAAAEQHGQPSLVPGPGAPPPPPAPPPPNGAPPPGSS